ncbi:MAG: hypothetical protein SV775_16400 [Thermodesulfobacteriota bacterium]|nr:hypothetical protein [Thermodesulfobacteriota bacterium]
MRGKEELGVVVVEKDQEVVNLILNALEDKPCRIRTCSGRVEPLPILREKPYGLILIGNTDEGDSPFDVMKEIVMASPMTSIILITDLQKKEVHDKAEGYGILGHVSRTVPSRDLISLIEQYEKVSASLSSDHGLL